MRRLKKIFPLVILLNPVMGSSQEHAPIAFISGHQFNEHIEVSTLHNEFSLSLNDTSFRISSFQVSWSDGSSIYSRVISGNVFDQKRDTYNLKNIRPGNQVAFDNILATKNNKEYKVASFVVRAVNTGSIPETEKNMVCYANLKGFRNGDNIHHTLLRSDQQIELSDPSYKIIDFELSWDTGGDDVYYETFSGDKIILEKNANTRNIKRIGPGSVYMIEKIRLLKDGKEYVAKNIVMYCK